MQIIDKHKTRGEQYCPIDWGALFFWQTFIVPENTLNVKY